MKNKLIWQLSRQNLLAHRKTVIPFILSSAILSALLYVIFSLINNDYVINRHPILQPIMIMAAFLSVLFAVIFIIYASLFIYKQRNQEIGLYSVLGMDKKHLAKMTRVELLIQWLIILVIAIPGGYLFGHLIFILLNRLMKDTGFRAMDYPFDWSAMVMVILITTVILLVVYLIHVVKLSISNPISLLQRAKAGAKETKTNYLSLIIGLVTVGYGYYLALSSSGLIQSINRIFIAIVLVIVGSYFLLGSLSIFTLKRLKANENYYYQGKNFLTISGMLYRMKANAVSLTSISILCTGLMIILGMTLTSYRSMEDQVNVGQVSDYEVSYYENEIQMPFEQLVDNIVADLSQDLAIEDVRAFQNIIISFALDQGEFISLDPPGQSNLGAENFGLANVFELSDYNTAFKENIQLKENQVGLVSNTDRWNQFKEVTFAGKTYEVVPLPLIGMEKIAIDFMQIALPEGLTYADVDQAYPNYDFQTQEVKPLRITNTINIDGQGDHAQMQDRIIELQNKYQVRIVSKYEARQLVYATNGGALFLGLIVSVVLFVGIFLMIYFKQISEGHQDKYNYHIMKQVGLPNEMIKKSIANQVIWIFALPLIIAIIHMIVSARLVFDVLGVIGVRDWGQFVSSYLIVIVIFILVYAFMYWITSRTYYQIVSQSSVA